MRIHYKSTVEDVVAFNIFHFSHSPTWRRQVLAASLIVPLVLFAVICAGYSSHIFGNRMEGPPQPRWEVAGQVFAIWLVVSILWCLFVRWNSIRTLARRIRQFWNEGSERNRSKWVSMELVGRRLIVDTDYIHSVLVLRAIEKIGETDRYAFVYISSLAAHIIPLFGMNEEHQEFVAALKDAWRDRESAPMLPDADDRPRIDERFMSR